jgi:hypothetical protein
MAGWCPGAFADLGKFDRQVSTPNVCFFQVCSGCIDVNTFLVLHIGGHGRC